MSTSKNIVRINLDETSVCLTQCEKRGWVLPEVRKRMWKGESVTGDVKANAMKTNFSHVCLICDDAEINKTLPQIFTKTNPQIHFQSKPQMVPQSSAREGPQEGSPGWCPGRVLGRISKD